MTTDIIPMACNLEAIPASERPTHLAVSEHLLTRLALETQVVPNGYSFRFAAEHFSQVAAFISSERRCCPFYHFALEVPPGREALTLHITGPEGAKDMLAATLLVPVEAKIGQPVALRPTSGPIAASACSCCSPAASAVSST